MGLTLSPDQFREFTPTSCVAIAEAFYWATGNEFTPTCREYFENGGYFAVAAGYMDHAVTPRLHLKVNRSGEMREFYGTLDGVALSEANKGLDAQFREAALARLCDRELAPREVQQLEHVVTRHEPRCVIHALPLPAR